MMPGMGKRKGKFFKSLANSTYGENRSTGGYLSDDDLAAFLLGVWVPCNSSNVRECRYLADEEILEIFFLDGSAYQYYGVAHEVAEAFGRAPSKGGAVWDYMIRQGVSYARVI